MKVFKKLVIPYVIWSALFIIIPMLLIALYGFTQPGNSVVTINFTLENFAKFVDPVFLKILVKSLSIAFFTTVICLFIGYPIAYYLNQLSPKSQGFVMLFMTMPMWINMLIRTYSWTALISDKGLINSFLSTIGLPTINIMYSDVAVLLGMVYNFLPFMILSIYTQLGKIDGSLSQASYDLGANWFQTFTKIIFPLSLPGVMSGITLVFLPAVSSFVIPNLLGGGNYTLIGNLIEQQFGVAGNWNFGSAISLIMTIVIIVSMWLAKKVDRNIEEETSHKSKGGQVYGRV